jgi:hypothetical protein
MKNAQCPFQFLTASYLVRMLDVKASTLADLADGIEKCSDGSIFFHTFQSLGRHHFLTEGFSNDFAQWILTACNRAELAEGLANLDIRDYTSIAELRADLRGIVTEYCDQHAVWAAQQAFEEFPFCEAVEVTTPLGIQAWDLRQFCSGLGRLSHASLYYHFVGSRLRLQLRTNDFSQWLENCLGLKSLATRINQIDIYTNTLDSLRCLLMNLVEPELHT